MIFKRGSGKMKNKTPDDKKYKSSLNITIKESHDIISRKEIMDKNTYYEEIYHHPFKISDLNPHFNDDEN